MKEFILYNFIDNVNKIYKLINKSLVKLNKINWFLKNKIKIHFKLIHLIKIKNKSKFLINKYN